MNAEDHALFLKRLKAITKNPRFSGGIRRQSRRGDAVAQWQVDRAFIDIDSGPKTVTQLRGTARCAFSARGNWTSLTQLQGMAREHGVPITESRSPSIETGQRREPNAKKVADHWQKKRRANKRVIDNQYPFSF
jgi:hypothetical protein